MPDRVLVAMSGGVDSSLAAALLNEQGFVVDGVTMKLTAGVCCDIASAQAVCSQLGIPHHVIDLQQEFEQTVVRDFINEYRAGRTPNPCIRCNEVIKFQVLLGRAREMGFDLLATGHYARALYDSSAGRYHLMCGLDGAKDQSYFLYRLSQDQLHRVLFPLGGLQKSEVRRLAAARRLPAAERPESQEVCFIPDDDYRSFLKKHAPEALGRGVLTLTDGTIVGTHEGVAFFTIGQRRGHGVAAGERLYVIRLDRERNRVILGRKDELETSSMEVSAVRFMSGIIPSGPFRVDVKVRYRSPRVPAMVRQTSDDRFRVEFDRPVAGVTPGQAAVFYEDDTVIGGGIIEK